MDDLLTPPPHPKQEAGQCLFNKALLIVCRGYSNDTMDMIHCDPNMKSLDMEVLVFSVG